MPEMILPDVYIDVRSEGLISAGPISTGNVGLVGAAHRGTPNKVYNPANLGHAQAIFGSKGPLIEALQLAFDNGARNVFAVRAEDDVEPLSFALDVPGAADGDPGTTIQLETHNGGQGYQELAVKIANPTLTLKVEVGGRQIECIDGLPFELEAFRKKLEAASQVLSLADDEQEDDGQDDDEPAAAPAPLGDDKAARDGETFSLFDGRLTLGLADGLDQPAASVTISVVRHCDIQATLDGAVYPWKRVPATVGGLVDVANGVERPDFDYARHSPFHKPQSVLVTATLPDDAPQGARDLPLPLADGEKVFRLTSGHKPLSNTLPVKSDAIGKALDELADQDVQIVVVAGAGSAAVRQKLVAHVQNASNDRMQRERIGVFGTDQSAEVDSLVAPAQDEGRLIYVGPGLQVDDGNGGTRLLRSCFTAAAVAGRLANLPPHVSPTNKTLTVMDIEKEFNPVELEQLVLGRVLALRKQHGSVRIVKGLTTSTDTAWSQITTRRIVDYAKRGVRQTASPFIGKLNNARVREAMQGALNGFLQSLISDEMIVKYSLSVSATREQEIRGICEVVMALQPTFSIDYVRVTMNLE